MKIYNQKIKLFHNNDYTENLKLNYFYKKNEIFLVF